MFSKLKTNVQDIFATLSKTELFVVDIDKNELFDAYIQAWPETERPEYICNCCRSFLNHYGNVVAIVDGQIKTLWDFELEAPYDKIPKTLRQIVLSKSISGPFLSKIQKLGTDFNHQRLSTGEIIKWEHFYVVLPKEKVIRSSESVESINGQLQGTRQVFERSLQTITQDAIETVLDLIAENALYRGKEFENQLVSFLSYKKKYAALNPQQQSFFVWQHYKEGGRIRNTAIGTLLVDLSEGRDLELAVKSFETIVAPSNYKRPTSLVTGKQIQQAQDKIKELGIEQSLKRRHATKDDIPVVNALYVNRDHQQLSVFDEMKLETTVNPKTVKTSKEITLDEFVEKVLPEANNVEVLLENNTNFVSLIAPEDADSPNLFGWDNKISWTYQNNMTDTIKEKVKQAGGAVEGELRISLEWFNYDDLDLHLVEPKGNVINFTRKHSSFSCGFLDIDMNAGSGKTRTPVENIIFKDRTRILPGTYQIRVNNYAKRETVGNGFNIQVECRDEVHDISYDKSVPNAHTIEVATFTYSQESGITNFKTTLSDVVRQKQVNNLSTNRFHKVNMITYSPNHWTNEIGNKHLFMFVEDAKIDTPLRPFFNEYLAGSLQEHRKVFEILGNKLMVTPTDTQMTGIGYSLTQKNSFITRVNDRIIKVNI